MMRKCDEVTLIIRFAIHYHLLETLPFSGLFDDPHIKGRFLLFQVYHTFANLFSKLSERTFYKEISKFSAKST